MFFYKLFAISAKFCIVRFSARADKLIPHVSSKLFISALGIPSPALREFAAVFLLCMKAAFTTLKKIFLSDAYKDGLLSIFIFITSELTFGAGRKLPADTLKSISGLA